MKRSVIVCAWMVVSALAAAAVAVETAPPKGGTGLRVTSVVTLHTADWKKAQEIVASHKGKIVVLDLWSTSCQPCVKEFPQLVKLQAAHPQDVVCISFNCNYIGIGKPEDERDDVLAFLTRQKSQMINLLSTEADEDLYKKVGIASIPVVQVYDRSGKLARQFDNEKNEYGDEGFTYEKHVTPYVSKLAAEK